MGRGRKRRRGSKELDRTAVLGYCCVLINLNMLNSTEVQELVEAAIDGDGGLEEGQLESLETGDVNELIRTLNGMYHQVNAQTQEGIMGLKGTLVAEQRRRIFVKLRDMRATGQSQPNS